MNKPVDRQEIETALNQAAQVSEHGSGLAASGRIDHEILTLQRVAHRLAQEAQGAYQSWANWEAINDLLEAEPRAANAIDHFEMAIGPVRRALARDAMLGAFRLSDPFDKKQKKDSDKLTLCRLVAYLEDTANRERLESEQWALDLGHRKSVATWAAGQNVERIALLRRTVVALWTKQKPEDQTLLELRTSIRPVRDKLLAHAIEDAELSHPTVDQIRQLMDLSLKLSAEAEFLFCGHGFSEADFMEFSRKQSKRMWQMALEAPISRLREHQEQRRKVLGDAAE
jgi:AbiU2